MCVMWCTLCTFVDIFTDRECMGEMARNKNLMTLIL